MVKPNDIAELLEAVDEALEFIDRFVDTETDPASDVGAQVPNHAGRLHGWLSEVSQKVAAQYDAEKGKK